jgi:hypothetical protein
VWGPINGRYKVPSASLWNANWTGLKGMALVYGFQKKARPKDRASFPSERKRPKSLTKDRNQDYAPTQRKKKSAAADRLRPVNPAIARGVEGDRNDRTLGQYF